MTHANVHADFPRAWICLCRPCSFTGCYASSGPSLSRSIWSAHHLPGYLVTSMFEFVEGMKQASRPSASSIQSSHTAGTSTSSSHRRNWSATQTTTCSNWTLSQCGRMRWMRTVGPSHKYSQSLTPESIPLSKVPDLNAGSTIKVKIIILAKQP